ncbi:MAG: phasin family protein [Variibacter sp.]|nr:phasin family protein [Variibacter sp.]
MIKTFDDIQKLSKEGIDAAMESFAAASKGAQTVVAEFADFARKSFEQSTSALEKLIDARTLDRAFEVQAEFARSAYEGFVTQTTKFGEIYADIAKQAYKPLESYLAKVTPTS